MIVRIVAVTATGALAASTIGAAVAGATSPPPPTVVTGAATSVTTSTATVSGEVNPNGIATSWLFEFGTTTNYGGKTATYSAGDGTSSASISSSLTGLAPGTTYHFRLVAWSSAGSSYGADGAFSTGNPAPTATTGSASGVSPSGATVTGNVDPNGIAASWLFEYGTSTNYGGKTTTNNAGAGSASIGVSIGIGGLPSGTTFHYRVVAVSAGGTTYGDDKTFATAGSPPTAVTGPASSLSLTTANVSANVDPNGVATSWHFDFGTSTNYGGTSATYGAGAGSSNVPVSTELTGLIPGTVYHYRIYATSSAGYVFGLDHEFTTPKSAPAVVTGGASYIGNTGATLSGTVNPSGLSTNWYFKYWDATTGGSTPMHSAGSGTSPVTETHGVGDLTPDTEYHYVLISSNAGGTSAGAEMTFVTTGPPGAITGAASQIGANSAELNGSVDPGDRTTDWYFEWGTSTGYGGWTTKHSVAGPASSVPVSAGIGGLAPGTTYHFRLISENSGGKIYGADATFTTPSPTIVAVRPAITAGRAALLSGAVPTGAANSTVTIFAEPAGTDSFVQVATVLTNSGGTWSLQATPTIRTSYKVLWDGAMSPILTLRVHPSVSLRVLRGGIFVTHVSEQLPGVGRLVRLQRLVHGVWRTLVAKRLNGGSRAIFRPSLPRGLSRLRVLITGFQAGNGYLPGVSGVHTYIVG